jgi:hypothetical protein
MTPLEKLLTLPEAARRVHRAREELMGVAVEVRRFRDVWSYADDAAA